MLQTAPLSHEPIVQAQPAAQPAQLAPNSSTPMYVAPYIQLPTGGQTAPPSGQPTPSGQPGAFGTADAFGTASSPHDATALTLDSLSLGAVSWRRRSHVWSLFKLCIDVTVRECGTGIRLRVFVDVSLRFRAPRIGVLTHRVRTTPRRQSSRGLSVADARCARCRKGSNISNRDEEATNAFHLEPARGSRMCRAARARGVPSRCERRARKAPVLTMAVGGLHGLYYLPLLAAHQLGYFKDEGST